MLINLLLILNITLGATPITLDEAIERALRNNPEILSVREKLKEAEYGVKEARASFFPSVELQGRYTYMSFVQKFTTQVPVFDPSTGTFRLEEMTMEFGKHNNYRISLNISQPLFTWGKILNSYRISKKNYEIEEINLKLKEEELKERVKEAYYEAVYARHALEISKDVLREYEEYYRVAQERFREGLISNLELLQAEVKWRSAIPDTMRASNYYKIAVKNLINLIGTDDELIPVDEFKYEPFNSTLEEVLLKAKRERLDLKLLRKNKETLKLLRKIEKAALRPSLFTNFSYTYQRPFGFEDRWDDSWTFTVGLQFPLFDGLKSHYRTKAVDSKIHQLELTYRTVENYALLEVESNYRNVRSLEEQLQAAKKSLELAEEAYKMARDQYREGLISALDFQDAEVSYKKARFYYLQILKDYNIALARLELSLIGRSLNLKGEEERK